MKHYSGQKDHPSAVRPLLKPLSISILAALSMSGQARASIEINQQQLTESCDATELKMDANGIDTVVSTTNCPAVPSIFLTPSLSSSCKLNSLILNNAGEITLSVNNCLKQPEVDTDGDSVLDGADNCPTIANSNQADLDSDNLGDVCDSDKDGDGTPNTTDAFPSDSTESTDSDSDGIGNNADNCPVNANSNQANLDSDTLGDVCDSDKDGDGTPNTSDAFPSDPAESSDSDQDKIGNNADNCPLIANRNQINTDGDSLGNACDDDDDNDGISDRLEYLYGFNPLDNADIRDEGDFDGDGYSDVDELRAGTNPRDADSHVQAVISFNVDHDVDSGWKPIAMADAHTPVVFAGTPSSHDNKPGVVRIRTTADNGFDVRFQPWDYLNNPNHAGYDPGHDAESIPLLILEEGRHSMRDGSIWEVGTFTLADAGPSHFQSVSFREEFINEQGQSQIPHLFLTVQSTADQGAVTVRAKNVTANDFEAALFEESLEMQDGDGVHAEETIGYVAIYSPKSSGEIEINGTKYPYAVQQVAVDSNETPVLINNFLTVQEEQSASEDTSHIAETYDVLGIGSALFAQDVSSAEDDTAAPRQIDAVFPEQAEWGTINAVGTDWVNVPLRHNYQKPVVVVDLDERDIAPSADPLIRLRRGLNGGFQVHVNGGKSNGQRVHYMVAEQGIHQLGGLKFEAGLIATSSDRIKTIDFSQDNDNNYFIETPTVFSSVMTAFSSDHVDAISTAVNESGFDITMDAPGHRLEVLGWIAIENGSTDNDNYNGREAEIITDYTYEDNDTVVLRGSNNSAFRAE